MAADGGAAPPPGGRDFWDGLLKEEHEQGQAVALEAMGKVWAPCRKPLSFLLHRKAAACGALNDVPSTTTSQEPLLKTAPQYIYFRASGSGAWWSTPRATMTARTTMTLLQSYLLNLSALVQGKRQRRTVAYVAGDDCADDKEHSGYPTLIVYHPHTGQAAAARGGLCGGRRRWRGR